MMETWPKLLKDTAGTKCFLHDHILIITALFPLDIVRLNLILGFKNFFFSIFQILGFQKDHFIEQEAIDSFNR